MNNISGRSTAARGRSLLWRHAAPGNEIAGVASVGCGPPGYAAHLHGMKGFTLFELVVVVTVVGILMAVAVPRARAAMDRTVVRSAASDVRATLGMARSLALDGHALVTVEIDSARGALRIQQGGAIVATRVLRDVHGVRVSATRESLTYDPYGLGRGASNLSVLVRKGVAVETIFVSRLGRIR